MKCRQTSDCKNKIDRTKSPKSPAGWSVHSVHTEGELTGDALPLVIDLSCNKVNRHQHFVSRYVPPDLATQPRTVLNGLCI